MAFIGSLEAQFLWILLFRRTVLFYDNTLLTALCDTYCILILFRCLRMGV